MSAPASEEYEPWNPYYYDLPTEDQINDWNIHNDHADGIEEDYGDE